MGLSTFFLVIVLSLKQEIFSFVEVVNYPFQEQERNYSQEIADWERGNHTNVTQQSHEHIKVTSRRLALWDIFVIKVEKSPVFMILYKSDCFPCLPFQLLSCAGSYFSVHGLSFSSIACSATMYALISWPRCLRFLGYTFLQAMQPSLP